MDLYKPVRDFAPGVQIAFSSAEDGCMPSGGESVVTAEHRRAVETFLEKYRFDSTGSVKVGVLYRPESTYTRVARAEATTAWDTKADAIFTTMPDKTIFLPVADCVATVVYDPIVRMIGVLHLGRHSSVAGLIETFAQHTRQELGSDPRHWHVWMSPSLQQASNRLQYFHPPNPDQWHAYVRRVADDELYLDIPAHNYDHFRQLGVDPGRIVVSEIDTYTDTRYFSHRAAIELGQPERQGRMIVAAKMTD